MGSKQQYTVWVHNSRSCRGSVYSCPRSLSLHFPSEEEITIAGYQVHKGGVRLSLPQTVRNVFLERLVDYILVKSTFGFSLAWDGGSGVYVRMTEEHKGHACGLCGNYNDDGSDDLTTSSNVQTEDVADFGNSWVVQLPQERRCRSVEEEFPSPCTSESRMDDAIEKCSALLFFPFLSCHENIDPNPYVASCVSDLCV
ncbi:otogelin-like protein [Anguilla anguilla]|uniref:otogelin-like protein n=1 Tax=Anguilla anguilla TaxID=7936 RepID=UPI0015AACCBF|nr:otogelin-like protein [Anguilla anguilla]